jgi:hypothetical protein
MKSTDKGLMTTLIKALGGIFRDLHTDYGA